MNNRLGCVGGVLAYGLAALLMRLLNAHRIRWRLSSTAQAQLAPLFPELDLNQVIIKDHANLLPNAIPGMISADGMALGYRLYFRHTFTESDPASWRLLIHELTHTAQLKRLGGAIAFGCAYGRGYLQRGYHQHPLEIEARAMAHRHGNHTRPKP